MNEQNNQEANHQESTLENSVEAESLADLEPEGEVVGGSICGGVLCRKTGGIVYP